MKNTCHSELVSESKDMTDLPPHPSPLPQGARERTRVAFTLAEVLITLGIIGVVAAMTIPTLMTKLHHKTLESQFKKAYSELGQIAYQVQGEFGGCENSYDAIREFIQSKISSTKGVYNPDFYNYNKEKVTQGVHIDCLHYGNETAWVHTYRYLLKDGAEIALCTHNNNTYIGVDINGQKSKPNAYGHDLFYFKLEANMCKLVPNNSSPRHCSTEEMSDGFCNASMGWINEGSICSKTSNSMSNGFGCTKYAIQNKCPDDESKTYWDCLP